MAWSAKHMKALTDTTWNQMDRGTQLEALHTLRCSAYLQLTRAEQLNTEVQDYQQGLNQQEDIKYPFGTELSLSQSRQKHLCFLEAEVWSTI